MSKLRGALLFSTIAQQGNLLLGFVTVVVVARLLPPAEVGVFAVATSVAVIGIEIRSFGVNQYLVREKELDDSKKRTALGIMMVISWSLAAIIIALAPFAASFFDQPDLREVFWILSGTFVLAPFSTVPFAMFAREMRFDRVMRVKLTSGVARAVGTIGFVLLGWSYFGLAAGVLFGAVVEMLAITAIDRGRNLLTPSFSRWREVTGFGVVASSIGVLQRFTQSVPDLVLGRMATMADVGMFSRGVGFVAFANKLISMAVRPLILPHLSDIRRRGGDVGAAYLKCIVLHGALSLPVFAVASVLSLPLIRLFFGDQWDAAAPIASLVAFAAMFRTVHGFLGNALLASGHERLLLGRSAVVLVMRLAIVIACAPHGLIAVAFGMCVAAAIELLISVSMAARSLGLSPTGVARAFVPNACLAAVCWAVATLTLQSLDGSVSSPLPTVALVGTAAAFAWFVSLRLLGHELWGIAHEAVQDGGAVLRRKLGFRRA